MEETEKERTLYDILGVHKTASKQKIKEAYKKRAKETHPDVGGDEDEFKLIAEAYEVLMDDDRRAIYDSTGDTEKIDNTERIMNFLIDNIIPAILSARDVAKVKVIEAFNLYVDSQFEQILESELDTNRKLKRAEEAKKRLKLKDGEEGEDIFQEALSSKIGELEGKLRFFEMEKNFLHEVKEYANKYEYITDELIKKHEDTGDRKVLQGNTITHDFTTGQGNKDT
jgi:curved DNA-binding protein CbpA